MITTSTHDGRAVTFKDESEIARKNRELETEMVRKFANFVNEHNATFAANTLIANPAYYVQRGIRGSSLSDIDKAIALDTNYSFVAHYSKALIFLRSGPLQSSHAKNSVITMLNSASQNLRDMIDRLQTMRAMLAIGNITMNTSPLANQTQRKIEILGTHIQYCDSTANFIRTSSDREYIALGQELMLSSLFPDDAQEVQELQNSGLQSFFEVYKYVEPEEEDDDDSWFGSLFSAIFGIIQIVIGIALAGMGGPMSFLGLGMIMEGVGDIWNSVISLVTGQPINMESFFKSKGISYAINFIVLGIQSVAQALAKHFPSLQKWTSKLTGMGKVGGALTKEQVVSIVKNQFLRQGLIKPITLVVQAAGDGILRSYKEEIEEGVSEKIKQLIKDLAKELNKILAQDAFERLTARQQNLYAAALHILHKYQNKYHSLGRTIAEGVAEKLVPGATLPIEAFRISQSLKKVLQLTEEFGQTFANVIHQMARQVPANTGMLEDGLRAARRYTNQDVVMIIGMLTSEGILQDRQVSCQVTNCTRITDPTPATRVALGKFSSGRGLVAQVCNDVYAVVCADHSAQGGLMNYLLNSFEPNNTKGGTLILCYTYGVVISAQKCA